MRALSLWQPWASAMALGLKTIETRHWTTAYRGPLLIHAAKRWTHEERDFWADFRIGKEGLPDSLPLGMIVATGNLVDVVPMEKLLPMVDLPEQEWGNYGPGRFGWIFENIVALPKPIPFKGAQGFFNVPTGTFDAGGGQDG